RRRSGRRNGSGAPGRYAAHGDRTRLRQANRDRGIPRAVARRGRYHQHLHERSQRHRGRRRLRAGGRRDAADHAAGHDPADADQPILNQFFTASRLRDNTTLDGFSMVALDPQKQGTVTSFSITNVSAEQRKPLTLRSLAKAHDDAKAEDTALNTRRETFQQENDEAVQRVVKAGRTAKLKGGDADVQASWFK